jgi:two-component system phosphate regulon sensor histidine kinase PhoR
LQTILAGMVEGVVAVDLDERVLLLNDVAGRILGADPGTAAGRPIRNVTRVQEIADTLSDTLRSGVGRTLEIRLQGARGARIVQTHAGPFGSPDEPQGAVVVLHDVTELRRLEAVRRDFVANVSHELKTPLTAIRAMLETMVDDPRMPDDVRASFLERMSAQVQRLAQIVTDLLGLARVESDPEELARDLLDLRSTVEETRRALAGAAQDKGIALEFTLPPAPARIRGDRPSLRLLVDNLVDNALKYTPSGGRVEVRLSEENGWATLDVADTGIGIHALHGDRIFERFYRVDTSRSRALGSTGLGLAIVRNVAVAHGGTVAYDSVPGRGTEFRVRLPLATDSEPA